MRTRSRLQNSDALTAPDRVFIEKSLPGIASVMAVMTVRTKTLQEKLKGFKQPFYLLADQVCLSYHGFLTAQVSLTFFW